MIGITLGDACGVGPEIVVRAFAQGHLDFPHVVFGDLSAVELACEKLDMTVPIAAVSSPDDFDAAQGLHVIDAGLLKRDDITIGQVSHACGAASVKYVEAATQAALDKQISGFVTLPINKEAARGSHPDFQGHTELIAQQCGVTDYTMMLASPKMIVTHVSTHVSLREAIDRVRAPRILTVVDLCAEATRRLRGQARIAVAGLNPHSGEHGAFGMEDIEHIEPAVQTARERGFDVEGPVPPDTLFMKLAAGAYDAAVCMYHDQGHIPMKLHGFDEAVNITIGLPITRTSVDHGTAFDIAYQGIASIQNFRVAIEFCQKLSEASTVPA